MFNDDTKIEIKETDTQFKLDEWSAEKVGSLRRITKKPKLKVEDTRSKLAIFKDFSKTNFKCEQCSFGTVTRRNLIRHIKYNHQSKPHSCKQCSYNTAAKTSLSHHINSVHATVKAFKCQRPG